jgi:hypothetical protein
MLRVLEIAAEPPVGIMVVLRVHSQSPQKNQIPS